MNASLSFRLLSATAAFGVTAAIFSSVAGLANVPTQTGSTTTLMALAHSGTVSPIIVLAMAD